MSLNKIVLYNTRSELNPIKRVAQRTTGGVLVTIFPQLINEASITATLQANGIVEMANNSGFANTLNWRIDGTIGGTPSTDYLNNQAWADAASLYFTEDGTNSTAVYALATNGDTVSIQASSNLLTPLVFNLRIAYENGFYVFHNAEYFSD